MIHPQRLVKKLESRNAWPRNITVIVCSCTRDTPRRIPSFQCIRRKHLHKRQRNGNHMMDSRIRLRHCPRPRWVRQSCCNVGRSFPWGRHDHSQSKFALLRVRYRCFDLPTNRHGKTGAKESSSIFERSVEIKPTLDPMQQSHCVKTPIVGHMSCPDCPDDKPKARLPPTRDASLT